MGDPQASQLRMPEKALITGVNGQDGSYLAEFLLGKGYEVWGMVRSLESDTSRIRSLLDDQQNARRFQLIEAELRDSESLQRMLERIVPDEIYHLAAQSHVKTSLESPEMTGEITGLGTVRLLEQVRQLGLAARVFCASSSEIFGAATHGPQTEQTPFHPRNPYGAAKAYAYYTTQHYRESAGMFACSGILFNHESPRRSKAFVTRKITRAVGRIAAGKQSELLLGNLDAQRDWGFAGDYVDAMWRMLQQDVAEDFVIATGVTHTVRQFCEIAFDHAGLSVTWRGSGVDEQGVAADGRVLVRIDPQFFRPGEAPASWGDPGKARRLLQWGPRVSFEQLVRMMGDHDLALARSD